ncbi:uncharacterized protein [Eurosta solidaginis]|uniref:uncharacterized protein n=1 Tax=Eurosta solidaginis TaxID=178769 RepID=UPI003530D8C8
MKTEISHILDLHHSKKFFDNENVLLDKLTNNIKKTQTNKYEKLRQKEMEKLNIRVVPQWFRNLTQIEIPHKIQWLLSLGPKYALASDNEKFPLFKFIADGENIIQTVKDRDMQEIARNNFTTLIQDHLKKKTTSFRDKFICQTLEDTKRFLKQNKQLIILNADKGNVTVVMDKKEYDSKIQTVVNDISTYRVLKRDPTNKLQQKNNELVQRMFNNGNIDAQEKKFLLCKNANTPRIYGLPKIHKENIPVRPICSSIDSPSYNLCKYVVKILEKVTMSSKYNVKDSTEFKNKVGGTYIYDDECLVSFDVVSLFPSIPVDVALEIISSKWDEIKEYTTLTRELFLTIVKFCIKENRYFKYNEKIYEQRTGMPMGSPASPVIADIVMEELLTRFEMEAKCKPRLLTKYVDDLFAIVKTDEVENMLKELNSYNKNIRFTVEVEKDGQLPYLDTLINTHNNKIYFDWYKKPTASGRLINYNSNHERKTILNTAKNFISRVLTISDRIYHGKNIAIIKKTLEENEFPSNLINKLIRNFKIRTSNDEATRETKSKIYKSIVYVPGISERIKTSQLYDKEKITLAFTYNNTLRQVYSNTKDRISKDEKSNIIYKIPCNGDGSHLCDKVYVGTTKLKLKTRISGHKSNIKLRNIASDNKTALTAHCKDTGHYPDFKNVSILDIEKHYNKRFTLEMLHIMSTPNDKRMNFKSDTDQCAYAYRHLLLKQQQNAVQASRCSANSNSVQPTSRSKSIQ